MTLETYTPENPVARRIISTMNEEEEANRSKAPSVQAAPDFSAPLPVSSVLSRLQAFLPEFERDTCTIIDLKASGADVSLEPAPGADYIDMDVFCGIADAAEGAEERDDVEIIEVEAHEEEEVAKAHVSEVE